MRSYTFVRTVTVATVGTYAGVGDTSGLPEGFAKGTQALFNGPEGIAIDSLGTMYVGDANNATIRKITPAGDVTTIAGKPGVQGNANGKGTQATFHFPKSVALDGKGNLFVTDANSGNSKIRQISLTAGDYTVTDLNCYFPTSTITAFNDAHGIAVDGSGNTIYVGDYFQGVFKLTKNGSRWDVTDYYKFTGARSVTIGPDGYVYVADDPDGRVIQITAANTADYVKDSLGTAFSFINPVGLTFDTSGNLYVTSGNPSVNNSVITKVRPGGSMVTLAGSSAGSSDGMGTDATFSFPTGLAFDADDNLYAADYGNSLIRKFVSSVGFASASAASSNTLVTTYAGGVAHAASGAAVSAEGKRQIARFNYAMGVARDSAGNVYVTSNGNGAIECSVARVSPTGYVTTLAVYPTVYDPQGIAVGTDGDLYIANAGGGDIVRLSSTDGFSSFLKATHATFSGWSGTGAPPRGIVSDGAGGFFVSTEGSTPGIYWVNSGSVVPVVTVGLSYPTGMAFDIASQTLYVADQSTGHVSRITSSNGFADDTGTTVTPLTDAASGSAAIFSTPTSVALDTSGNVYVACLGSNNVQMITTAGIISTVAGSGVAAERDGDGIAAQMNGPWGIVYNSASLYVTDNDGHTVRRITLATKPAL